MNALVLVVGTLCIFMLGYRYYGAFLATKVAVLDPNRRTPAYELEDGRDYHPTNKWVLFGHHFAAIAGAGPLVGPVLAAQFGYLPGLLWIIIGATLAGAVHDYIILFASVRMRGLSLSYIAEHYISRTTGIVSAFAIIFIIITALAGLGIVVVNALANSPWGTFTIAATIPAALIVSLYMYKLRPGRVAEASTLGVILVILAVIFGGSISVNPVLSKIFLLSKNQLSIALAIYGFIASVLPVYVLLCPRDYLSSYMKLGTIALLAIGIFVVHPNLKFPAVTQFIHGGGPIISGPVWPFLCITIMCGAISGFHALIGSGTTPKMIKNERDILPIGYGAMLVEGFISMMALIAATSLSTNVYYAINIRADLIVPLFAKMHMAVPVSQMTALAKEVGETTLMGRTGGAISLAVGMAQIFSGIPGFKGLMAYWYHFVIMFEALFTLTTVDAGTRVARFIVQELGSQLKGRSVESVKPQNNFSAIFWSIVSSIAVCFCWGYMVYRGSIMTIWPMFGVANQLLAAIALAIGTSVILQTSKAKYALVTFIPMVFVLVTTVVAAIYNIIGMINGTTPSKDPVLNITLTAIMLILALIIAVDANINWIKWLKKKSSAEKSAETITAK